MHFITHTKSKIIPTIFTIQVADITDGCHIQYKVKGKAVARTIIERQDPVAN